MIWRVDGKAPEDNLQEANQSETSVHYDRLCAAAEYFGLDAQKQKTKEEMDELAELLGDYSVPDRALRAARIEELADVYNMLDQLCILWDCEDEVQDVAKQKMIRTMERIERGITMKHEEKAAHGCKLFYCTRRKAYVCCSDCSLNPEYGGTCKDGCTNSPEFCGQQAAVILDREGRPRK